MKCRRKAIGTRVAPFALKLPEELSCHLVNCNCCRPSFVTDGSNMNTSTKSPRYSAEQIEEIVARITTLRARWLRAVEAQLAPQMASSSLGEPQSSSLGEPQSLSQ